MLHTFKQIHHHHQQPQSHKCQVDCTNHDQVINKLELKSKDLYFFWRNYQWLYNKYYNEQRKPDTRQNDDKIKIYAQKIQQYEQIIRSNQNKYKQLQHNYHNLQNQFNSLQSQISVLTNQNNNYKLQINGLIKDLQRQKSIAPQIQQDYKRQIKRLKQKLISYQTIESNYRKQLDDKTYHISRLQREFQNQKALGANHLKRYEAQNIRLQQALDKLRLQFANMPNPNSNRSLLIHQSEQLCISYDKIQQQTEQLINLEMEKTRTQLKQQLGKIIFSLSERQLESVLVDYYP